SFTEILEVRMPRRSPGEIRSQLPRRCRHGRSPVIRGLSASANRQIASFERSKCLHRGTVADAFRRWVQVGRRSHDRDGVVRDYDAYPEDWRSGDCHVRTVLEHAAWSLRRKARRELRAAIDPFDDRYEAHTVNNPFVSPGIFWWLRRIERWR